MVSSRSLLLSLSDDVIWANKGNNVLFGDVGNDCLGGAEITVKYSDEDVRYFDLLTAGAFDEFTSERIFEDKSRGMLA